MSNSEYADYVDFLDSLDFLDISNLELVDILKKHMSVPVQKRLDFGNWMIQYNYGTEKVPDWRYRSVYGVNRRKWVVGFLDGTSNKRFRGISDTGDIL